MKRRKQKREPLPPPCRLCRDQDGNWMVDAYAGGLERCTCARGRALGGMKRGKRTDIAKPQPAKSTYDGRMAGAGKESE